MLQQTQVDRVLPKYEEWLKHFPSLEALARARLPEATRIWRPLGYNVRPRRLHKIARDVVLRYGGNLPSDADTLRSFKGLGEYTVGAILCFAFGMRVPIVDTNIARVLFRVFIGSGDRNNHIMRRHLWKLSSVLLPRKQTFDFNQALMDLGATVCKARTPRCGVCPMRAFCKAFISNATEITKE